MRTSKNETGSALTTAAPAGCILTALVFLALSLFAAPVHGAPITFNTALPVTEGEGIFRAQARYARSTDDPTGAGRERTVWAFPVVLVYGVSRDITLFASTSYVDRKLSEDTSSGRTTRGAGGLGDTTLTVRYTAWKRDLPGETMRLAPFASAKTPTGEDDASDGSGALPRTLQPGTGSWDYTVGSIFTWQTLARQIDGSVSYTLNTGADGFEFGDVARLDLSYQHRLLPRSLGPGLPAFVYAVMESRLQWQGKNEAAGVTDEDSGGVKWFLTPGVQYVTVRTVTEAAVEIPVVQDLNGSALGDDYTAILSFRVNF